MRLRMAIRTRLVCVLVISFIASTYAAGAESRPAAIPLDQLSAACQKAKAEFRPLTADRYPADQDASWSRPSIDSTNGCGSMAPMATLGESTSGGTRLQQELRGGNPPDKALLASSTRVMPRRPTGWSWCGSLTFNGRCTTTSSPRILSTPRSSRTAYDTMLDKLAAAVESYADRPTAETALVIGESVRRLEDTRQAESLVQAIRMSFRPSELVPAMSRAMWSGRALPSTSTT